MLLFRYSLCLLLFSCFAFHGFANQPVGADLTYTCIGPNQYRINLTVYHICNTTGFAPQDSIIVYGNNACTGTAFYHLLDFVDSLVIPEIYPETNSTCLGGSIRGYKAAFYTKILDLSAFPSPCTFKLAYENGIRSNIISNLAFTNPPFYIETVLLDTSTFCNSSPSFTNFPRFVLPSNNEQAITHTVSEPDGDSIVYRIVRLIDNNGIPINYGNNLSTNQPFPTVTALSFDSLSSQMRFQIGNPQTVAYDLLIEEYRGQNLIGYSRRTSQITSISSTNLGIDLNEVVQIHNGIPVSQGSNQVFEVCPGDTLHFRCFVSDPNSSDTIATDSALFRAYPNAFSQRSFYNATTNEMAIDVWIPNIKIGSFTLGFTDLRGYANSSSYAFRTVVASNCSSLSGRIARDTNNNCLVDNSEAAFNNAIVRISKGNVVLFSTPDAQGNYQIALDTGSYQVALVPMFDYWGSCLAAQTVNITTFGSRDTIDFPVQALTNCPLMYADISNPKLLHCQQSYYEVRYCNRGTIAAVNTSIEVTLDSLFVIDSTSLPISNQQTLPQQQQYTFQLGTVPSDSCGLFRIYGTYDTLCDLSNRGQSSCAEAQIYPDTSCLGFNGPSLRVEGRCVGDSVSFRIRNVGNQGTTGAQTYWVIEDIIIFYINPNPINLPPGAATPWQSFLATGATYRLEATQAPGHPWGSLASATVVGCQASTQAGNPISTGIVNQYAQDDQRPDYDVECQENVFEWGLTAKEAFPIGYDVGRYIYDHTVLEYRLHFQNIGVDTAQHLVLVDTLSPFLDPASIQPNTASHPYQWQLLSNGVLAVEFYNLNLPDSTTNATASQGFIDFHIHQQPNNSTNTLIDNQALAWFDQRPALRTNTTIHRVGNPFMLTSISKPILLDESTKIQVFPNPFEQYTTIQVEGQPKDQVLQLQLFDLSGRLVTTIESDNHQAIHFRRPSYLLAGCYLYQVKANNRVLGTGKMIAQ